MWTNTNCIIVYQKKTLPYVTMVLACCHIIRCLLFNIYNPFFLSFHVVIFISFLMVKGVRFSIFFLMQVKYLQIAKKSKTDNLYRWVRYVTQANSYVARLWSKPILPLIFLVPLFSCSIFLSLDQSIKNCSWK